VFDQLLKRKVRKGVFLSQLFKSRMFLEDQMVMNLKE
jgi:hypothetical protein